MIHIIFFPVKRKPPYIAYEGPNAKAPTEREQNKQTKKPQAPTRPKQTKQQNASAKPTQRDQNNATKTLQAPNKATCYQELRIILIHPFIRSIRQQCMVYADQFSRRKTCTTAQCCRSITLALSHSIIRILNSCQIAGLRMICRTLVSCCQVHRWL